MVTNCKFSDANKISMEEQAFTYTNVLQYNIYTYFKIGFFLILILHKSCKKVLLF